MLCVKGAQIKLIIRKIVTSTYLLWRILNVVYKVTFMYEKLMAKIVIIFYGSTAAALRAELNACSAQITAVLFKVSTIFRRIRQHNRPNSI